MFSFVAMELLVFPTLASPCVTLTLWAFLRLIGQRNFTEAFHGWLPSCSNNGRMIYQYDQASLATSTHSAVSCYKYVSAITNFLAEVNLCILGPYQQNSILLPQGSHYHLIHNPRKEAWPFPLSCSLWQVLAYYWGMLVSCTWDSSICWEGF